MFRASPAVLAQRLGQAAEEAAMLARFTRDLPGFLGSSLSVEEDEAPDSSVRLTLRIHPSVGDLDEESVRDALLADLGGGGSPRHDASAVP